MRVAELLCTGLLLVATGLHAAPPMEMVETRLEAVNPASREIVVNGETWALSSTVTIQMPGKLQASLRDVAAGMNVRLLIESGNAEFPVVRSITVLPD
ncbi:MAG: hypothetical protein Q8N51_17030 [Gammaproteobacteria bacterium]|nr:hypothetical protein [Gammaproteobacteria bacterium]